ncbi:MAG: SAP domain-containing protein, partial [Pseudomonadota bacterium]
MTYLFVMTKTAKPHIAEIRSAVELRRWYWLKTELVDQAKALGLATSGGKFEILDRIAHFLET